jgi:uncharacterized protein
MNPTNPQQAIIDWLSQPSTYQRNTVKIQHIETHISHVFVTDDLVFKLKKPVSFDFLDFSTLELREKACRDELQLNRRTAPEVYIAVEPVYEAGNAFRLNYVSAERPETAKETEQIVDWVVVMRRLPAGRMMDRLIVQGLLDSAEVDRLTSFLNHFHATATRVETSVADYRNHVLEHVHGNQIELMALAHHLPKETVTRVHSFQLQLLNLKPEIFDRRVHGSHIVDGHGDLRPEHICFANTIAIYDCVEFNAELRTIDRADEIAFLAAECDYLGASWIGPKLFNACCQQAEETVPELLWNFYKSYRACVRAKVAALRADQLDGKLQEEASKQALLHLQLADHYARPSLHPLVIIVGGLSGTGKSTLARELSKELGAEWLRTDVIRKSDMDRDYSSKGRDRVYLEMFERARELNAQQISVVLDATFSNPKHIELASEIATNTNALFIAVQCVCRPEIALQRIANRLREGSDPSDATADTYKVQLCSEANWPDSIPRVLVDTELNIDQQKDCVFQEVRSKERKLEYE